MFLRTLRLKNLNLRYLILIPFFIIPGLLILTENRSVIAVLTALILFLFYIGMIFKIGLEKASKYTLYFIIFTIPFPYFINFMKKDALTMTTMAIFLLFTVIAFGFLVQKKIVRLEPKFAIIWPILIFFGLTISLMANRHFIGQSIRRYVENISGILLYFIMLFAIKKHSDIIRVIKIVLFALLLQSAIAFLQLKLPGIASYFTFFGTRTFAPSAIIVGGFTRATGTIWDYELLAQWFLIGSILSIAIMFEKNKYIYSFYLFCYIVGIFFTKTRSDIILFVFTIVMIFTFLILFRREHKGTLIKIILITISIGILVIFIFPNQADEFSKRLGDYFHSQNLISAESINRKEAWEFGINSLRKPALFGSGLHSVESLEFSYVDSFHSLYLTLLYQIGIFGLSVYALFWLKILHSSWLALVNKKKCNNWYTLFFLFICVILMLVDGIKIEYLRYGHTIQFAWMIYALIIIALKKSKDIHENTLVS